MIFENIMMMFANFIGGGLVLFIGLILRFVKGSEAMIAGYNTMSKEEQAKWNVDLMRRFIGNIFIFPSCIVIIAGIAGLFGFYPLILLIASWVIFTAAIIFCLIYLNTSPKFKNNPEK